MMKSEHSSTAKALLGIWILFVFELIASLAETCEKIDDCSCKKDNGKVISLREIDGGSKGPAFKGIRDKDPQSARYQYSWNPCTAFTVGDGCEKVLMCQVDSPTSSTAPVAKTLSGFEVNSVGTIIMSYQQYTDSSGFKRVLQVSLVCDDSKYPGETDGVSENFLPKNSAYSMIFKSKCACDDGCVSNPSGSTGLSIGSILLIVFFVVLFVYLIGGVVIKKYKMGVENMPEMIPNYEFWAGIPSLVKDGVVFTCTGLKTGCTSLYHKCNKDAYAKI